MNDDPIVKEVRRVREALAAQFDFDLRALYRALKDKEKQENRKTVTLAPKRISSVKPVELKTGSEDKETVR